MTAVGNTSAFARALMITAALVIVLAGMKAASAIIVPFLLAAFLAVICAPPLVWMNNLKKQKHIDVSLKTTYAPYMYSIQCEHE